MAAEDGVSTYVQEVSRKEMVPGILMFAFSVVMGLMAYVITSNSLIFVFMLGTGALIMVVMIQRQYLARPIRVDIDQDGFVLHYRLHKPRINKFSEIIWLDISSGAWKRPPYARFKLSMVDPIYISHDTGKALRHDCERRLGSGPPTYEEWFKVHGGPDYYGRIRSE